MSSTMASTPVSIATSTRPMRSSDTASTLAGRMCSSSAASPDRRASSTWRAPFHRSMPMRRWCCALANLTRPKSRPRWSKPLRWHAASTKGSSGCRRCWLGRTLSSCTAMPRCPVVRRSMSRSASSIWKPWRVVRRWSPVRSGGFPRWSSTAKRAYWCRWNNRPRARLSRSIRPASVPISRPQSTVCGASRPPASVWAAAAESASSATLPGAPSPRRLCRCTASLHGDRFVLADRLNQRGFDRLDALVAVDALQEPELIVALDHGERVAQVHGYAIGNDLAFVVGPLVQIAVASVAHARDGRRIEDLVIRRLAALAQPPTGQAFHEDLCRHLDVDGAPNPAAALTQSTFERFRLGDGTREAVEQRPTAGIRLFEAVDDHVYHERIWHEVAAIHVRPGGAAEVRTLVPMLAQQVAAGDVRNAEDFGQEACLGALAGAGSAEQQYHFLVTMQPHCCCSTPLVLHQSLSTV